MSTKTSTNNAVKCSNGASATSATYANDCPNYSVYLSRYTAAASPSTSSNILVSQSSGFKRALPESLRLVRSKCAGTGLDRPNSTSKWVVNPCLRIHRAPLVGGESLLEGSFLVFVYKLLSQTWRNNQHETTT